MERKLAILSIVVALIHFSGETWWHLLYGQFLPMLIVDYIAVALLLFAGIRSLQSGGAIGLLCGAWGFEFCLNYRTLFWRVEVWLAGDASPQIAAEVTVLGVLLIFALAVFLTTLYLCNKQVSAA
ncbi:MAG: hypothetical protein AAF542_08825 [Pseudomonadota bacterium]